MGLPAVGGVRGLRLLPGLLALALCLFAPGAVAQQIAVVALDPDNISEIDPATVIAWDDPDFFIRFDVNSTDTFLQDAVNLAVEEGINEVWIVKKDGRQPWKESITLTEEHGELIIRGYPFEDPQDVIIEAPGGTAGLPAFDISGGVQAQPTIEGLSLASLDVDPVVLSEEMPSLTIPPAFQFPKDNPADVIVPQSVTASSTTSVAIPAGSVPAQSDIVISETGNLEDLNVTVNVESPDLNNLEFVLRAPGGVLAVQLVAFNALEGTNMTDTTFDDEASVAVADATPPYSLRVQPTQPLNSLGNPPINGTWTLAVTDLTGGGGGAINSWSLEMTTQGSTPEVPITVTNPGGAPELASIRDVNLQLEMTSGDLSQVAIFLRSPEGTVAQLVRRGDLEGTQMIAVFDDEGPAEIEVASDPYSGRFRPSVDPLSVFDGEDATQDPSTMTAAPWQVIILDGSGQPTVTEAALWFGREVSDTTDFSAQIGGVVDVGKVVAELLLTYIDVSELEIRLESPNGTVINLAKGPLVSGPNYGDGQRTIFDDDADRDLDPLLSPYEGEFRPLEPLSRLRGTYDTDVTNWTIRVINTNPVFSGTLEEWAVGLAVEDPGPVAVNINAASPTLNRCYIYKATDAGVLVRNMTGEVSPSTGGRMTNTVVAENEGDGVRIENDQSFEVLYSSILLNGGDGVETVDADSFAFVANSLIYRNGRGLVQTDGSLTANNDYVYENGGASPPELLGAPNWINIVPTQGAESVVFPNPFGNSGNNPMVQETPTADGFIGKIAAGSPLIDAAVAPPDPSEDPILAIDFNGDTRTDTTGAFKPEVGADELSEFVTYKQWIECHVSTANLGDTQYIGVIPAGDLRVEIAFNRGISGRFVYRVFIMPQGQVPIPGDKSNRIEMEVVIPTESVPRALWVNRDPIRTVLVDNDGNDLPSLGDVIADGHGAVYMGIGPFGPNEEFLGDNYTNLTDPDTIGDPPRIVGQALQGRHVVIDTTPPVLSYTIYTPPVRASAFVPVPFANPTASNDVFLPSGVIGTATHPYPALPTVQEGQDWLPASVPVPEDDGGIGYGPDASAGQGGSIFFNVASVSNGLYNGNPLDPVNNLKATVRAILQDDVVRAPDGTALLITDWFRDPSGNDLFVHQPAGFLGPAVTAEPREASDLEEGDARWRYTPESDVLPANTPYLYTTMLASSGLDGWDPYSVGFGPVLIPIQDQLAADWVFEDGATGNPSIPFNEMVAPDGRMRLSIQFLGEDLAGNTTPLEDNDELGIVEEVLDPLNLWWITETQARLLPNRADSTVLLEDASFRFDLQRNYDVTTVGQPEPVFTYRLFVSTVTGNDPAAAAGPYIEVPSAPDWSNWSTVRRLTPAFFQAVEDANTGSLEIVGRFVILVIAVTDEAGNVSPWPSNDLILTPGGGAGGEDLVTLNTLAGSGPEWQRFFISGDQAPDTSLVARFWWNRIGVPNIRGIDQAAGEQIVAENSDLVPSPPAAVRDTTRVEGEFNISASRLSSTGQVKYRWQFEREGDAGSRVTGFIAPAGTGTIARVVLPEDILNPGGNSGFTQPPTSAGSLTDVLSLGPDLVTKNRLEDPFKPVTYVFRVSAWQDTDNDGVPDPGEPIDPTPTNYAFTVVPTSNVGDYVDPKDRPEDQPIKVQESR